MKKRVARFGLISALVILLTGIAGASASAAADQPQGADYLTWSGSSDQQRVASNPFEGNGVAGARSVLAVPEPSSFAMLGGALALMAVGYVRRERARRPRD